jgi:hypothetical protein
LVDGGFSGEFNEVNDYDFWENDYTRYIYAGTYIYTEGFPRVYRFDQQNPIFAPDMWGSGKNIELSRQDTNKIITTFLSQVINFISTDWGNTWDTLANGFEILSISPFNDSTIFASQWLALFKSTDGGSSFTAVDTGKIYSNNFLYDNDGIHIYALDNRFGNHLIVSVNSGNAFSWSKRYSSNNPIYISIDYSQSGKIYLADGRRIYLSDDYGSTFNEFKVLDRKIVGIYKKTNSDKLYAATKYNLYEITPDTTITLKHLTPDPALFSWYPLKIGNKWVYEKTVEMYRSRFSVEVIDDTIINGSFYFKLKTQLAPNLAGISHQRLDSTNGIVYRYSSEGDIPVYDFTAIEIGDTVIFNPGNEYWNGWFLEYELPFNEWGINSTSRHYNVVINTSGYQFYTFVKDIGLYKDEGGEVLTIANLLKGFIKDGIVYGDTSLIVVNVKNEEELPLEFSLSQNYPNPFNPSTRIEYRVASREYVTLKVYDVLGREVANLVNEEKQPGVYEIEFSAGSFGDAGNLASGVYYYQLKAGSYVETKKMIYLK